MIPGRTLSDGQRKLNAQIRAAASDLALIFSGLSFP
jgi:hypothetical protein